MIGIMNMLYMIIITLGFLRAPVISLVWYGNQARDLEWAYRLMLRLRKSMSR